MSWLSDLVGKKNIDAISSAYKGSSLSKSVDAIEGAGLSALDYGKEVVQDIQKYKADNESKQSRGNAWYQSSRPVEGPKTQYEQFITDDRPLEDASEIMLGKGLLNSKQVVKQLRVPATRLDMSAGDRMVKAIAEGRKGRAITRSKFAEQDRLRTDSINDVMLQRRIENYMDKDRGLTPVRYQEAGIKKYEPNSREVMFEKGLANQHIDGTSNLQNMYK